MKTSSFHTVQWISLTQIDEDDRLFSVSVPWIPMDSLIRSVRENGILCPLQVQEREDGRFRIVMGFRRFRAAQLAGLGELPCLLREKATPLTLFRLALDENLNCRPLHLLEKAHVLLKLRESYRVSEQDLLQETLPLLGIRADRFQLRKYLSIARLGEGLQRSLAGGLEPDLALGLNRWTAVDQDRFLLLLTRLQPGLNRQKELFTLLDELRAQQQPQGQQGPHPVTECWRASGAEEIESNEQLPPTARLEAILQLLHRLRFPSLAAQEQRYRELKASLRLPPQLRFQPPRYFEGDRIQVSFSFGRAEELEELGKTLLEVAGASELKKILELL